MSGAVDWQDVLEFWLGTGATDPAVAKQKERLWFRKSAETDKLINDRFGPLPDLLAGGQADEWAAAGPRGRLAVIIALDQFPRNLHRGAKQAFAYDAHALDLCKAGLAANEDNGLHPFECMAYYMPLEHSEDPVDQTACVARFTALLVRTPTPYRELVAQALDYAQQHKLIIDRFGRFPHRNAALGRASTAEEAAYLKMLGSGF